MTPLVTTNGPLVTAIARTGRFFLYTTGSAQGAYMPPICEDSIEIRINC